MPESQNYQNRYLSLLEQIILIRGGSVPTLAKVSNAEERELQLMEVLSELTSLPGETISDTQPSSPGAGDRWVQADENGNIIQEWSYRADLSRWVTPRRTMTLAEVSNSLSVVDGGSGVYFSLSPTPHQYNTYVEHFVVSGRVASTNDGSNYWKYDLVSQTGTENVLATVNTQSLSPNQFFRRDAAVNTYLASLSNMPQLGIRATMIGTSANTYPPCVMVVYRIAI